MEERKKDHINLAFQSRVEPDGTNKPYDYEPLLAAHPSDNMLPFGFAGKTMQLPVWVSSMTGGTAMAGIINRNLAKACAEFGMGMGLGSCRALLDDDKFLSDFDIRDIIGDDAPLYANLGVAQVEKLISSKSLDKVDELIHKLKADGIIIHVNPLQEAFQPEGDRFSVPPVETIQTFLENSSVPLIVKEVGQGMGPESLRALLKLPLEAIEFGALGGTNFTKLELLRHQNHDVSVFESFKNVGHTAEEMTQIVNEIVESNHEINCRQVIVSGGITDVLQGHFLAKKCKLPAVFGMGSAFLKHATEDYSSLKQYVQQIKQSILIAEQYLMLK
ncbi:beta/alpha barrel domain-containing protein [Alkalitalea saponilacus]|uniref:Isopentenyl-diphosphate delta-isomerase n=1 Tax=Alkalitalea saponilacus TaxID=889453 RepID=A0A1T5HSZ3_9BACT|nr:type 2 isopentenyl-diphosphate Delta-isomerase [Alkalitalea saponilacus]ASB47715.1 type 2 isopentenyl-diphosphate Delta-isomerase [Alkalitalea saponilacus]SKC23641.1 isopentenyl-diphosphate delta-isomerase [Alkalitalea saponilacus]